MGDTWCLFYLYVKIEPLFFNLYFFEYQWQRLLWSMDRPLTWRDSDSIATRFILLERVELDCFVCVYFGHVYFF